MKYNKELHDWVKSNNVLCEHAGLATVTYTTAVITALLDEIERLQNQAIDYVAVNAELVEKVERLQAERRWIPVSERLPDDCLDVIICEIVMDYECVSAGFYDEAGKQWFSKSGACDYVSHWMPLPELPDAS